MYILGIHTGHDASAAIFDDFKLVAFTKEERISRVKCDGVKIPDLSITDCLIKASISINDIDVVALSRSHFSLGVCIICPSFDLRLLITLWYLQTCNRSLLVFAGYSAFLHQ